MANEVIELGEIQKSVAITITEGAVGTKSKTYGNTNYAVRATNDLVSVILADKADKETIDIVISADVIIKLADAIKNLKEEVIKQETKVEEKEITKEKENV